jgi:GT2 family glycosyltransferase
VPIVVIGRNEGEQLRRCICAALRESRPVVYVDSGSSDGSSGMARSHGLAVVELDSASPYTAARARNAGFQFLLGQGTSFEAVQFVDGDCELAEGWVAQASAEMERRPEVAVVCGRRRERHAGLSIYTRLCELEWDTPAGEIEHFGGDALMRVSAFRKSGGFNPHLIAGEEPELSLRLQRDGWKIVRLPREMTLHESHMTRFDQWWRRSVRSGHAYAEGAWLHGLEPEHHWLRQSLSIWFWGVAWPLAIAGVACVSLSYSALLALLYPVQTLIIYARTRKQGRCSGDALLYALFCVLGKFPQALGQMRFQAGIWFGRRSRLIEYKSR